MQARNHRCYLRFETLAILTVLAFSGADLTAAERRLERDFSIRVYTRSDGLPSNLIQALLQSRGGSLWVGTSAGLARFSGGQFTIYNHNTHPEFVTDRVRALAEDTSGRLWVGTENGLLCFEDGRCQRIAPTNGLPADEIVNLCAPRNGDLLIGTTNGLIRFRQGRLESILMPGQVHSTERVVRTLHEDAAGRVWLGDASGVKRWIPETDTVEDFRLPGLPRFGVGVIQSNPATNVWAHTGIAGILRLTPEPLVSLPAPPFMHGCLLVARSGEIWCGTAENGLHQLGGKPSAELTHLSDGLPDKAIHCLLEDRDGNIWVGTDRGGLVCLQPRHFRTLTAEDGLPHPNTWTVCPARQGGLWIGTDAGVALWREGTVTPMPWNTNLANPRIRALHEDTDGTLWIGTGDSLEIWNGTTLQTVKWDAEGAWNKIRAITRDRFGNLWVGRAKGLMRLHEGVWSHFGLTNGLPAEDVRAVLADRSGALWLGTYAGGLCRAEISTDAGRIFRVTNRIEGLPCNDITTLHEDAQGVLWVATERGLGRVDFREGKWHVTAITPRQGLASEEINEILDDNHGHLWLSCDTGVYCVRREELNDLAAGRATRVRCIWFDESDGMLAAETNGQVSHPAGARTPDGRLWFPTTSGLAAFNPAQLLSQVAGPSVVLERIVADRETLFEAAPGCPFPTELELALAAGRGRTLEIHYTAPIFRTPSQVRYRHRLVGMESTWNEAGSRRVAFYGNLKPGRYQFEVRAASNRDLWGQEVAVFPFRLMPHFYQTAWFWPAVVVFAAALAGTVVWWRLRELQRMHALEQRAAVATERERIARDIHDDLGAGLTRLTLSGQNAAQRMGHGEARGIIQDLTGEAAGLVDQLGDLVWCTNQTFDTLDNLLAYLREYAGTVAANAGLSLRCGPRQIVPSLPVTGYFRRQVLLMSKEVLTNITRHARATEIRFETRIERLDEGQPPNLELVISDNGRGLDATMPVPAGKSEEAARPHGNGLPNLRKRAKDLHGFFDVQSTPGQGTTVRIQLPLSP